MLWESGSLIWLCYTSEGKHKQAQILRLLNSSLGNVGTLSVGQFEIILVR